MAKISETIEMQESLMGAGSTSGDRSRWAATYYWKNVTLLRQKRRERYANNRKTEIRRCGEYRKNHLAETNARAIGYYWKDPEKYREKARLRMRSLRSKQKLQEDVNA